MEFKLSIIIPFFNDGKYIGECLNSVLTQNYSNFEIILVNDGSTDNSIEIVNSYIDPRVKVIEQKNCGQSIARNTGLEYATGDYIWFIDADDVIFENSMEKINNYLKSGCSILFFGARSFFDNDEIEKKIKKLWKYDRSSHGIMKAEKFLEKEILNKTLTVSPALFVYKRSDYSIRFAPNIIHEDNLFLVNLIYNKKDAYILSVEDKFYYRRIRQGSTVSSIKSKKHFDGYNFCIESVNELNKSLYKSKILNIFIQNLIKANIITVCEINNSIVSLYYRRKLYKYLFIKNISLVVKFFCLFPELFSFFILYKKYKE